MRNNLTKRSHLLGIGLDNDDGHQRITRSEDFSVVGGSEQTHEKLTETAIKTVEDLSRKGKTLHSAAPEEIKDLIAKHLQS
jgi:hypothetical protein